MTEVLLKVAMIEMDRYQRILIALGCSFVFIHVRLDMMESNARYHDCNLVGKVPRCEVEAANDASCLPSPREVVSGQSRGDKGELSAHDQ